MSTQAVSNMTGGAEVQPVVENEQISEVLPKPVEEQLKQLQEDFSELTEARSKVDKKIEDLTEELKGAKEALSGSENALAEANDKTSAANKNSNAAALGQQAILRVGNRVLTAVQPILNGLVQKEQAEEEQGESKPLEPVDQNKLANALKTLELMEKHLARKSIKSQAYVPNPQEISEFLSAHIVAIEAKDLANRAEEIKNLKTGELAKSLQALSARQKATMEKVFNPEVTFTTESLKAQLEKDKTEYTKLTKNFESLEKSIQEHLKGIEGQVKEYNETVNSIPIDHYDSISHFEKVTSQDVVKGIEERKLVNEARIEEHDKLAKEWSDVLTVKEAIEWQLKRIEIHANIFTDVKTLNGQLSALSGDAESLKALLRKQEPTVRGKEDELNKLKEEKIKVQGNLCKLYKELSPVGSGYRENAEGAIKTLGEQKEEGGKALLATLEKIHVYNEEIKEGIVKSGKDTILILQDERQKLYDDMKYKWDTLFEYLNTPNTQKSLAYEINRLGYAIEEYNCKVPTDSFYNTWSSIGGWTPKDYVVSPFAPPKEENTKAEDGQDAKVAASTA